MIFDPVCGCDNVTYGNDCEAICQGITNWVQGPCSISNCVVNFNYSNNWLTIDFEALPIITSGTTISYYMWDFGDSSSGAIEFVPNISYTYAVPGTYVVTLSILTSDGCLAQYIETITVGTPSCNALFAHEVNQSNPLEFSFIDSSYSPAPIIDWMWDFGDGNTINDQSPIHTYSQAGVYNVCLTISDMSFVGCIDTYCDSVLVSNTCQSFFTYDIDTFSIIAGQSFANVQFNDESTNASWWQWDISDGSTYLIQNPYHEFDLSLTNSFEVCLLSVNLDGSCSDTYCDSIFFEVSTTNISNYNSNEIKIYPNPFNEYVIIETNYGIDYQIIIYDAFGREIESTNCYQSKIHITSLNENGVYILTINENGKLIYKEKLILIK